jgi:hypothetical protein
MPQVRGPFPLPTFNLPEGSNRVTLATGGVFYFPSGNYLATTDANSIVQVWDPIEGSWRTFLTASGSESIYCDGFNMRGLNTTGIVTSTTISNAGSGMTNGIGPTATGVAMSVAAPSTTGAPTATLYAIVGGSVQAPTVSQAGSGFLVAPLVVIDPPPAGGIQATAVPALTSGGGIASITMVNVGAGYTASPNFWLIPQAYTYQGAPSAGGAVAAGSIPPPGLVHPNNAVAGNQNTSAPNGALLTTNALTGSGTLTGAIIINSGGGYTAASPAVTISGGSGGVAVTATVANTTPANATIRSQPRVQ